MNSFKEQSPRYWNSSFFMVTLKASLVFSSTSLSNIPPSPKTWSGDTNLPLGASTLAYFRLNSVGGYLDASDGAEPAPGDMADTWEWERQEKCWRSQICFHLHVCSVSSRPITVCSSHQLGESSFGNREERELNLYTASQAPLRWRVPESRIYLFGLFTHQTPSYSLDTVRVNLLTST